MPHTPATAQSRTPPLRRWMQGLAAAAAVMTGALAAAAPVYVYQGLPFGDTAGVADINDQGLLVWSGFCDGGCRSIVAPLGVDPWGGYLSVPSYDNSTYGALVTDINNDGDMLGTALKNGAYVPTMWLDGVLYDLSDPFNAGLVFDYDAGPKRTSFALSDVEIVNLPDMFLPEPAGPPVARFSNSALTNSRGDLVLSYSRLGTPFPSYAALTMAVPEPSSLALVLALLPAGLALGGSLRRQRPRHSGRSRRAKPLSAERCFSAPMPPSARDRAPR